MLNQFKQHPYYQFMSQNMGPNNQPGVNMAYRPQIGSMQMEPVIPQTAYREKYSASKKTLANSNISGMPMRGSQVHIRQGSY